MKGVRVLKAVGTATGRAFRQQTFKKRERNFCADLKQHIKVVEFMVLPFLLFLVPGQLLLALRKSQGTSRVSPPSAWAAPGPENAPEG